MKFILIDGRMCLHTSSRMERSWQVHRWYRGARNTAYLQSIGVDLYEFSRYDAPGRAGRVTEVRRAKRTHRVVIQTLIAEGIEDYFTQLSEDAEADISEWEEWEREAEQRNWLWFRGDSAAYVGECCDDFFDDVIDFPEEHFYMDGEEGQPVDDVMPAHPLAEAIVRLSGMDPENEEGTHGDDAR